MTSKNRGMEPVNDQSVGQESTEPTVAGVHRVRVVIVDDHSLVREGTTELLNQEEDFEVVGTAGNGEEGLELIETLRPDVALVDVNLPGMSGVEMAKDLLTRHPELKILILSAYDDYAYVTEALDAGVAGYMLKTATGKELVDAIRTVFDGVFVLDKSVSARLARHWRHEDSQNSPIETLTRREREVLDLLAKGMSNKHVASDLSLGLRTVEGHVSNILAKLGVSSRTEAVLLAIGSRMSGRYDQGESKHAH